MGPVAVPAVQTILKIIVSGLDPLGSYGEREAIAGTYALMGICAQDPSPLREAASSGSRTIAAAAQMVLRHLEKAAEPDEGASPTSDAPAMPVEGPNRDAQIFIHSMLSAGVPSAKVADGVAQGWGVDRDVAAAWVEAAERG